MFRPIGSLGVGSSPVIVRARDWRKLDGNLTPIEVHHSTCSDFSVNRDAICPALFFRGSVV
ncbi:hypothetical protein M8C13_36020 [Crossiella sp. SN42]|uniref:hypothetical protein n=1 Tax=Crossiella sp. SN42 TaxID=2944808 RepID=UPI00207CD301|nr:hypothetical protein [Crossiella sp. SN42]MCO1581171.1 hypothetical protein [Crossiella sp. SN42]